MYRGKIYKDGCTFTYSFYYDFMKKRSTVWLPVHSDLVCITGNSPADMFGAAAAVLVGIFVFSILL
jgi:hypothetical protein